MQAAGELRPVAEREQDTERQCGETRDERDAVELVEPLERREALEDLTEARALSSRNCSR